MPKKVILSIISFFAVVSLCACGKSSEVQADESTDTGKAPAVTQVSANAFSDNMETPTPTRNTEATSEAVNSNRNPIGTTVPTNTPANKPTAVPAITPTTRPTDTPPATPSEQPMATPTEVSAPAEVPAPVNPKFSVPHVGIVQLDPTDKDGVIIAGKLDEIKYLSNFKYACSVEYITSTSFDINNFDCLIIPSGVDINPKLYGEKANGAFGWNDALDSLEISVIQEFLAAGKPILGICRGSQLLNVILGGTLYQDIPNHTGGINHMINIYGGLMEFAYNSPTTSVNSYHHESIKDLGEGLTVTARHDDGTIEAYEDADRNIYGIQWHPEYTSNGEITTGSTFLKAFLDVVYSELN